MPRLPRPRLVPVLGALALAAVAALTGCSAGQIAQTAQQVTTVNGSSADIGDLALRDIRILFPSSGRYATGSTARLALIVVNRGLAQDRLVDVTGDFFDAAGVPSNSNEQGAEPRLNAAIPPEGSQQFGTSNDPTIELTDLADELDAAQVVSLTFVFEKAGEVTVEVPVANPTRVVGREDGYDFSTDGQPAG